MQKNKKQLSWVGHVPMTIFTAATAALTILDHQGMAIYFAVLTFLAWAASQATTHLDNDKEDK